MNNNQSEFLIVHKSILPTYFFQVIKAKNYIDNNKISVSEACKKVNISRSTYYKYKDFIFIPSKSAGKKIIIALRMENVKGTLSNVLQYIASLSGNILSINQDAPLRDNAYVTISIDAIELELSLDEFLVKLRQINNISSVELLAIE